MFSLLFSPNSFWFLEHLLFSLGTGAACYFFYKLKEQSEHLRPSVLEKLAEESFFLQFAALHVFLQFLFHFVYPFSILDYGSRFVFFFFIIYLNKKHLANADNLTTQSRNLIEKVIEVFIVFIIFICFLSILNSQSANACGQSTLVLFVFAYMFIGAYSCGNAANGYMQANRQLTEIMDRVKTASINELRDDQTQVDKLLKHQTFLMHFFLASFVSCFVYALLFWLKLASIDSKLHTCQLLFSGRNWFFKLLFVIAEFASLNCINAFVVFHTYWKNRSVIETQTGAITRMTEDVFEDKRSAMIKVDKQELMSP